MKITPLELRQFEFEKTFRGYSIEEVDMFINNLAQEWERVLTETKMMRMQLELAEKEATKLREIEMTLFKTLKTAEDTSTMITEQANQQAARNISESALKAESHITNANIEAEKILSEARLKANQIINEAEKKSADIKTEVFSDVKAIEKDFASLKLYQENLISQLKTLASTTIDHVNRFEEKFDIDAIESKIKKANEVIVEPNLSLLNADSVEETSDIEAPVAEEVETPVAIVTEVESKEIETPEVDEVAEETVVEAIIEKHEVEIPAAEIADVTTNEAIEEAVEEIVEIKETAVDVVIKETELEVEPVVEDIIEEVVEEQTVVEDEEVETNISENTTSVLSSSVNKLAVDDEPHVSEAANDEVQDVISSKVNSFKTLTDDLTRIEGIGPKTKDVLNEYGIKTFRDLATTPLYKIKDYLTNAGPQFNLVDASTWTEQALLAAEGRWDDLEARQAELIGGKDVSVTDQEIEKEEVVEKIIETPKPVNNLENITEEMLEKVNKVKSAIRKAMTEKADKPEIEKDNSSLPTIDDVLKRNKNKGGSFFDNID